MVFRKFFGMIMSVSTLTIGRGAATPRSVVNFSIVTSRFAGINGLSPPASSQWPGRRNDVQLGRGHRISPFAIGQDPARGQHPDHVLPVVEEADDELPQATSDE